MLDTVTAKGKSLKVKKNIISHVFQHYWLDCVQIEGPLVLQIQKIRNVTAPKINESSNAHPKLLKLTLTDGHTTINCLDLSKNPILRCFFFIIWQFFHTLFCIHYILL